LMCDAVDDSYCARIRLSRPRLAGDTAAASLIPLAMCACRSLGLRGDESVRLSDASTQPKDADPWRRGCWDQRPATNPGGKAASKGLETVAALTHQTNAPTALISVNQSPH